MKQVKIISLILCMCCVGAKAQVTLAGENYIVLYGGKFDHQKINFNKAEGDWFATSGDAHATIMLNTTFDKRLMQLGIEWDGKQSIHSITDEIRHNGLRTGDFFLSLPDKDVYGDGLNASPSGDQEIKIEVSEITDTKVSGKITGYITEDNEAIEVKGVFNLSKPVVKPKVTNKYKDCDNVIHDKLTGAENRSPSECEVKFDLDSRKLISEALAPLINAMQNKEWTVLQQTRLDPLSGVQRESETRLFNVSYDLRLQISPEAAIVATYKEQTYDLNKQMQQNYTDGKDNTALRARYANLSREINGATNMNVSFFGNGEAAGLNTYRHPAKISRLANGAYCIYGENCAGPTGGGEDNAVTATLILLGNWKQQASEKFDDGGEGVRFTAMLNPAASKLQMQNMVIRIESNQALAEEALKLIDFTKLMSLINGK